MAVRTVVWFDADARRAPPARQNNMISGIGAGIIRPTIHSLLYHSLAVTVSTLTASGVILLKPHVIDTVIWSS